MQIFQLYQNHNLQKNYKKNIYEENKSKIILLKLFKL